MESLREIVLNIFGISIPAFRIAGGIVLVIMGIRMIYGQENLTKIHIAKIMDEKTPIEIAEAKFSSLIVPIAIPLFVGPATMSTIILYANKASNLETQSVLIFGILLVTIITMIILIFSENFLSIIGENGLHITLRIMGIILLSIGIQFLINGIGEVTLNLINPSVIT